MLLSSSQHLRFPAADIFHRTLPAMPHRILSFANKLTAPRGNGAADLSHRNSNSMHLTQSSSLSIDANMRCRGDPELGLAAVLFVISMVLGSFFSLLVVSLPALHSFKKLAASTAKLSKVVSEEVPGTLSSLKLSGMEINDLTCQLNNLKKIISGDRYVERERKSNPKFRKFRGRDDTFIS